MTAIKTLLVSSIFFVSSYVIGQQLTISDVQLAGMSSLTEVDGESVNILITLRLSDLSDSPTLEISMNEGEDCDGFYKEYFHIKSFPAANYIKHRGITQKITAETIELSIALPKDQMDIVSTACIVAVIDDQPISNLIKLPLK